MTFEIGKFYQHNSGQKLAVLCETETTQWGLGGTKTLIAECDDGELTPVCHTVDAAVNWREITREAWMESFS